LGVKVRRLLQIAHAELDAAHARYLAVHHCISPTAAKFGWCLRSAPGFTRTIADRLTASIEPASETSNVQTGRSVDFAMRSMAPPRQMCANFSKRRFPFRSKVQPGRSDRQLCRRFAGGIR